MTVEIPLVILAAIALVLIEGGIILLSNLLSERAALRDACKLLRQQRDEARQEVCLREATPPEGDARRVAKGRGWDCFHEKEE